MKSYFRATILKGSYYEEFTLELSQQHGQDFRREVNRWFNVIETGKEGRFKTSK